MSVFSLPS